MSFKFEIGFNLTTPLFEVALKLMIRLYKMEDFLLHRQMKRFQTCKLAEALGWQSPGPTRRTGVQQKHSKIVFAPT